ncbi:hypothetical protein A3B49_00465 [Candidatus Daviesbacteria bacterium RIFCSPLOWO2_01_FULL_40_24]|uniref:Uncharacterized protein n=1 Tax=Candidatus Daviesbacteria bacterium RIFCSPLOWO2_01_FULL_40_24 TaxID=1797787 RepID=A0A1F5MIW3_9BACT|nr:MAG: hypothetical protein A3B49_00465 [Candidatus Daviesbacteria bacterium RIFCSPLOWO2_01_FULL_40_24]
MKDQSYPVIKFSSLFSRQRKLASPEIKIAFRDSLELFVEDMNHPQLRNHMLRDRYAGYRSINVTEDWRAIFKIHLAEGRKIEPETLIQEYMADLPSRRSEVALESSWLRRSDNRSLYEQQTLVRDYQRQLQKRIPDVRAILCEAPDYIELAGLYFDRTGEGLFNSNIPKWIPKHLKFFFGNRVATRTTTPLRTRHGNFLAMVTTFPDGTIRVDGWPKDHGTHLCVATALIVPFNADTKEL